MLGIFAFEESNIGVPWYKQALPLVNMENERAKILWDIPMHLGKRPSYNAIKPDMIIIDNEARNILLIEGTICAPGYIEKRDKEKQKKYTEMRKSLERLNPEYAVNQINIVFDFLSCYGKELENQIKSQCEIKKKTQLVIKQCQKWVLSQNIVKTFYKRK